MGLHTTTGEVARNMFITGAGIGSMISVFQLSAQNAVPISSIGIATGLMQFIRWVTSTIGLALIGLLVTPKLPGHTAGAHTSLIAASAREDLASALRIAFFILAGLSITTLVIALRWVPEITLRVSLRDDEPREAARDDDTLAAQTEPTHVV
jgi:hypothetical protein